MRVLFNVLLRDRSRTFECSQMRSATAHSREILTPNSHSFPLGGHGICLCLKRGNKRHKDTYFGGNCFPWNLFVWGYLKDHHCMVNKNVTNRHESQGSVPLHPGSGLHLYLLCRQMMSGAKPESRKTAVNAESQCRADTARWERSCRSRGQLQRLREQSLGIGGTHFSP